MNILDSYFGIFEGAEDSKHRQVALDLYKKLLERFRTIKDADLKTPKPAEPYVSMNVGELLNDPEYDDLDLAFIATKETSKEAVNGKMSARVKGQNSLMSLYVGVPEVTLPRIKTPEWKKIMKKNIHVVFSRMREIFWHEFIHYADLKRMSPKSQKGAFAKSVKASREGGGKYYSDPLEYNAFVQQGLIKIDDFLLSGVKDKAEATRLLGGSPTKFYQMVLKVIPYQMQKAMTDDYKNKLKKRVAQMWMDTMSRLGGE